ncbi:5742_t:CDS:2 [Paraglomus brasilianum]|uniref:5742_t:CDS:1 n=1 Tax=Paraglomus brasilianum TaxID=144538 RepID=A0A9N9C5K7_9GLOM|nr:5742_t:CDS:2 [Paraglomus brasilianum]
MIPTIDFRIVAEEDDNGEQAYRCSKCKADMNTRYYLCKRCFQEIADNASTTWTSEKPNIDEFILNSQRDADQVHQFIEWIPFDSFTNIEFVAEGGFAKVYKASWKQGCWECLTEDDTSTRYFKRRGSMEVALKEQKNSVTLSVEYLKEASMKLLFLNENRQPYVLLISITSKQVAAYLKCEYRFLRDNRLYGLSVNPETSQIILVMRYMSGGDLRQLLIKNPAELTWSERIEQLSTLMRDLQTIHKAGFIHKDFHSGNVLWTHDNYQNYELCISDLGLSGPANDKDDKVTGVVPYMAPEILQGQPKSTASDIYAFGIVMWEFSSGQPAFFDFRDDDISLFKQRIIKDKLRPVPVDGTPDCYVNLMEHCWRPEPEKRPTAEEVLYTLLAFIEMNDKTLLTFNDTVFDQFESAEESRLLKGSSDSNERFHHDRYTSGIIDTDYAATVEDVGG